MELLLKVAYRKQAEKVVSCQVSGEKVELRYTQAPGPMLTPEQREQLEQVKPEIEEATAIALTRTRQLPSSTELPEQAVEDLFCCKTPQEVAAFLMKYGPLQDAQPENEESLKRLDDGTILAQLSGAAFLEEAKRLRSVIVGLREFREQVATGHGFADVISGRLEKKAVPLLKPNGTGGFASVLFCDDLLTALYAQLFVKFAAGKPYLRCAREGCEEVFERKGDVKAHCSARCQQADAAKLYRTTEKYHKAHRRRRKKHKRRRAIVAMQAKRGEGQ